MDGKFFSELCYTLTAAQGRDLSFNIFFITPQLNKKERTACPHCEMTYNTPVGSHVPVGAVPPEIAGNSEFYMMTVAYPLVLKSLKENLVTVDFNFYLADASSLTCNEAGEPMLKEVFEITDFSDTAQNWLKLETIGKSPFRDEPLFLNDFLRLKKRDEPMTLCRGDVAHIVGDMRFLPNKAEFEQGVRAALARRIHLFDVLTARDFGGNNPPDPQSAARFIVPEFFPEHVERPTPEQAAHFLLERGKAVLTPFSDDTGATPILFDFTKIPDEHQEDALTEFMDCVAGEHEAFPKGVLRITRYFDTVTTLGEMSLTSYEGRVFPAGVHRIPPPGVPDAKLYHPETQITVTPLKTQLIEAAVTASRRVSKQIAPIRNVGVSAVIGPDDTGKNRLYVTEAQIGYCQDFDKIIPYCDRSEKALREYYKDLPAPVRNTLLFNHVDVTVNELLCDALANIIRAKVKLTPPSMFEKPTVRLYGT